MELTSDQAKAVREWIEAGDGLSEVQRKLSEELGISMTYMDVRFLVDDLGAELKDLDPPKKAPVDLSAVPDEAAGGSGGVSVDVDRVTKAGAVASGTVVFSDGTHATWALDPLGRLALKADQEGYRPSEDDLSGFQEALSAQLRQKGM